MQVTLDQNEIETGIRLYLDTQFKINEGQEITIDMKAGRGENGFSATIDIVPAGTVRAATEVVTSGKNPLGLAEKTARQPKVDPRTAAPVQSEQAAAEPEQAQDAAQEAAQDAGAAEATQAEAGDEAGQESVAQGEEGTTAARPSLFAGLSKPKNS